MNSSTDAVVINSALRTHTHFLYPENKRPEGGVASVKIRAFVVGSTVLLRRAVVPE